MRTHPDGSLIPALPDLRFTSIDAARLGLAGPRASFMEAGEAGPVVLCLHGIGASSTCFRFVFSGLGRVARVIAPNAPGYFLSDPFLAEAPRAEDYADAAAAFLESMAVSPPVHVIGSSFGAMTGAMLAARHPHWVDRLVLIGASRGQRWRSDAERADLLARRAASVAEGGLWLAETRWQALVTPGTGPLVQTLVQTMLAATNPAGLMQAARATDAVDIVADAAGAIRAPTLVLTGAEDAVNPPAIGDAIAAAIGPHARVVNPAGIGHLPELEAPALTLGLIADHLGLGRSL
ncbi:MAG: alpha/beta hydrolase [Acetobacteraceae bacterium]|jgi:pimeloyl-ACP methyl ester carboxylesterase|nr:alpha/beta hydrolase [Acetobacteraceae bacterium]